MTEQERHEWLNLLARGRGIAAPYTSTTTVKRPDGEDTPPGPSGSEEGPPMYRQTQYATTAPIPEDTLATQLLRGLLLMDVTIKRQGHYVGRVDVSGLALLRCLTDIEPTTTVGDLVDVLRDSYHESMQQRTPAGLPDTPDWAPLSSRLDSLTHTRRTDI